MADAREEEDPQERIRRARERLERHLAEMASRSPQEPAGGPSQGAAHGAEPVDPGAAAEQVRERLGRLDELIEQRIGTAAAAIEDRVGQWVNVRVQTAERRLELQTEALQAALGEETEVAARTAEQIELSRQALIDGRTEALESVAAAVTEARSEATAQLGEQVAAAIAEAEARLRSGRRGAGRRRR